MIAPAASREVRLPVERFYWAVLDTGSLPNRALGRGPRLGYLFESVLPVPIDTIHAVYHGIDDHRVLACGMDRSTLAEHLATATLVLGPAALPGFLEIPPGPSPEPLAINLLVGAFEPRHVRRSRKRVTLVACTVMVLSALVIALGQLRRGGSLRDAAASFDGATTALYDRVLPPSTASVPPAARLTAELRSLDRTRGERPADHGPQEVTPALAAVLASWPEGLHVTTDSLSASPTAIALSVRLPDEAAAERFERELKPPPGWRLVQPNVQRERDAITVRVRMEPVGEGRP